MREQLKTEHALGGLIDRSARMQQLYQLIAKFAMNRYPVLIVGESGTGKELAARAIHRYGPSRNQPFVPVDCGALTPALIESELFGHVLGAFTGASRDRLGLLGSAGCGTLFLDEVAELPVEHQAKLFRFLQEQEFRPIGSNKRIRLEARIIAATNQDLEAAMTRGTFRKELYFRLNVLRIEMPPLRERTSDIPALVRYFLNRHGGLGLGVIGISTEAMTRLVNYEWPGNVRELENYIQRALSLSSGSEIQVKDLPSNVVHFGASAPRCQEVLTLPESERQAILRALQAAGGNCLRAAKLLRIGKTTIYRKLKEYGLKRSERAHVA